MDPGVPARIPAFSVFGSELGTRKAAAEVPRAELGTELGTRKAAAEVPRFAFDLLSI